MAEEAVRKEEMYEPQSFSVDDVEISTEEKEDTPEVDVKKSEEEFEIEVEGEEKGVVTEEKEADKLRRELADLKDEVLRLSSRREEPKQAPPPQEAKPEKLTRGQIAKILEEHKDDPEVLLNVIDYMSEQKALEIKDTTVKDMNQHQWASNLSGIANRVLADDEDGYLAANPNVVRGLEEMAGNLGLNNHPIGKLAAYAIYRLSSAAKTSSKVDDKSTKATKELKTRVMDKTRTSGKSNKSFGLTDVQLEVAKKFGVKPETYAKFVRRS
jgi:hypothetical protein